MIGPILRWLQERGDLPASVDLTRDILWDDAAQTITRWNVPGVPEPTYSQVMGREADYLAATADERRLKTVDLSKRDMVLLALALRASASWADMTAQERGRVMAVIDQAGEKALEALRT